MGCSSSTESVLSPDFVVADCYAHLGGTVRVVAQHRTSGLLPGPFGIRGFHALESEVGDGLSGGSPTTIARSDSFVRIGQVAHPYRLRSGNGANPVGPGSVGLDGGRNRRKRLLQYEGNGVEGRHAAGRALPSLYGQPATHGAHACDLDTARSRVEVRRCISRDARQRSPVGAGPAET